MTGQVHDKESQPVKDRVASSAGILNLQVLLGLALLLAAGVPGFAQAPKKGSAEFEVLLPPDAELEVDGFRTKSQGDIRRFQSAPVAIGGTYAYTLQATWHGKKVTQEIRIQPGKTSTFDLRKALEAATMPAPAPSIALETPRVVTLAEGQSTALRVHVTRTNYDGPVVLHLAGLPEGVTAADATIGSGSDEAVLTLKASTGLADSARDAVVDGVGEQASTRATVKIAIKTTRPLEIAFPRVDTKPSSPTPAIRTEAPSPPQNQHLVQPVRPAEAGLDLSLDPRELVLVPGESRAVHVRVRRKDSEPFDHPPEFMFDEIPTGAIQITPWAAAMTPDQKLYTKDYAIRVSGNASDGERTLRILAKTAERIASGALKVTVNKAPAPLPPQPVPEPELEVTRTPAELTLAPGETGMVVLQVRPLGGLSLTGSPSIRLEDTEASPVTFMAWSSNLAADLSVYSKEYAVRVAADAPLGERQIRILARGNARQAETTIKVTIVRRGGVP